MSAGVLVTAAQRWSACALIAMAGASLAPSARAEEPALNARMWVIPLPDRPGSVFRVDLELDIPDLDARHVHLQGIWDDPPGLEPARVARFIDGDEPMALIVLLRGGSLQTQAAPALARAFNPLMVGAGPPGSSAAILREHGQTVLVERKMSPIREVDAAELDPSSASEAPDAETRTGLSGLREAWLTLSNQPNRRRVLVIVGDTQDLADIEPDDLTGPIIDLQNIDIEAFFVQVGVADDRNSGVIARRIGYTGNFVARDPASLESALAHIAAQIANRYVIDFLPPTRHTCTVDGERAYVLQIAMPDGPVRESPPLMVEGPICESHGPPPPRSRWKIGVLIGTGVLAVLAALWWIRRS